MAKGVFHAPRELSGLANAARAFPPASLALGQDRRKCFWIARQRPFGLHGPPQLDDSQPDRTLIAAAKLLDSQLAEFFLLALVLAVFCADAAAFVIC